MKTLQNILALMLLCFLIPGGIIGAHGEGGLQLSIESDGFTADFDYSYPIIEAKVSSGRLSFDLFTDDTRNTPVGFTELWVRINQLTPDGKEGTTTFAGPVAKQRFGKTGFLYSFYDPGKYIVSARYSNNGENLTTAEFEVEAFQVRQPKKSFINRDMIIGASFGFGTPLVVLSCYLLIQHYRRRNHSSIKSKTS